MPETVVEREVRADLGQGDRHSRAPQQQQREEQVHEAPQLASASASSPAACFPGPGPVDWYAGLAAIGVDGQPFAQDLVMQGIGLGQGQDNPVGDASFDPSAIAQPAAFGASADHHHPSLFLSSSLVDVALTNAAAFAAAADPDGAWPDWTLVSTSNLASYDVDRGVQPHQLAHPLLPPHPRSHPAYAAGSPLTRFASTSTSWGSTSSRPLYNHTLLPNETLPLPLNNVYDSLHSPMLNLSMMRMTDPPAMSHYRPPSMHRTATASSSSSRSGSDHSRDPSAYLGSVRCYWALLVPRNGFAPTRTSRRVRPPPLIPAGGHIRQQPIDRAGAEPYSAAEQDLLRTFDLEFLYLDPVLSAHMAAQGMDMLDRGVTEFVHPDFRDQFRQDLYDALSVDDLVGSMTGTTFARVSRIRTILGCPKEDLATAHDADTFCLDDEYLNLNLTVHWACNGMLLAFFHATVDKDPTSNNDVSRKQEDLWTNFCGTAVMPDQQIKNLWQNVSSRVPCLEPVPGNPPPSRSFIIYSGPDAAERPDQVIFAWPPPRIRTPPDAPIADGLDSPRMDGLYYAEDLVALMKEVRHASESTPMPWGQHGQSSCTARFEQIHELRTEGVYRKVHALYIPYGNLTFASFQTTETRPLRALGEGYPPQSYAWNAHTPMSAQITSPLERFEAHSSSPSLATSGSPFAPYPGGHEGMFASAGFAAFPRPDTNGSPHYPDSRYGDGYGSAQDSTTSNKRKSHPAEDTLPPLGPRPVNALTSTVPPPAEQGSAPAAGINTATPTKRPHRRVSAEGKAAPAVRLAVAPPPGVTACIACGTETSPEWRRSERGIKELCNACGLKLARKQAKAEGRKMPRKKKRSPPAMPQGPG